MKVWMAAHSGGVPPDQRAPRLAMRSCTWCKPMSLRGDERSAGQRPHGSSSPSSSVFASFAVQFRRGEGHKTTLASFLRGPCLHGASLAQGWQSRAQCQVDHAAFSLGFFRRLDHFSLISSGRSAEDRAAAAATTSGCFSRAWNFLEAAARPTGLQPTDGVFSNQS